MFECFISDARKGSPRYSDEDGSEDELVSRKTSLSSRPPHVLGLPGAGVRRDRTSQFARTRTALRPGGKLGARLLPADGFNRASADVSVGARATASTDAGNADELWRIYEEASQAQTSLLSKLAQHNGLRQFGADFQDRLPPLELRIMLPELEEEVQRHLERLKELAQALASLGEASHGTSEHQPFGAAFGPDAYASDPRERVRMALAEHIALASERAQTSFDEQKRHLRELQRHSPLLAPISPTLSKRLMAAMSPPSTSASPRCPYSPPSPSSQGSVEGCASAPMIDKHFSLGDSSDNEDEDNEHSVVGKPFSAVFTLQLVVNESTKA